MLGVFEGDSQSYETVFRHRLIETTRSYQLTASGLMISPMRMQRGGVPRSGVGLWGAGAFLSCDNACDGY